MANAAGAAAAPGTAAAAERNSLSTLNGCFIPCLLTILGATLFLRLGFAVGMVGLLGTLGILLFAETLSCITISSFSAMAANGCNGSGGAYFMISRSLGLPYGAASGLMFWISYCLNAAFNAAAFTEMFQSTFLPKSSWWSDSSGWSGFIISSLALIPLTMVAFNGVGAFAKVNAVVFAGLAVACVAVAASLFFWQEDIQLSGGAGRTYTTFNGQTLVDNLLPSPVVSDQCHGVCNLEIVFGIVFPAVVGMMEGLNLIGDLATPAYSLPAGTYSATLVAFVVYVTLTVGQAGTLSREALQFNMDVLQKATFGGGSFVVLGVATACLSTVLGSLFGAARILQAMARDEVFPCLTIFRYGTPQGDEPQPAVLMSYLLAQASLLIGALDDLAAAMTIFFLLTYCLTDFSCFRLEYFHKKHFNPTFRFYSWQTSLANCVLIVVVMFYLSPLQATFSVLIFLVGLALATYSVGSSALLETRSLCADEATMEGKTIGNP